MFDNGYITLDSLVTRLNLPKKFLKDLVKEGDIPYLEVNGRLRFSEPEVRGALAYLAQNQKDQKRVNVHPDKAVHHKTETEAVAVG